MGDADDGSVADGKYRSAGGLRRDGKKKVEEGGDVPQIREMNKAEDESRDQESQGDEDNAKKLPTNDFKDTYEMSKVALLKWRQMEAPHKDFLRAGEGHFVSNPFRSVKQTYRQVFATPDAPQTSEGRAMASVEQASQTRQHKSTVRH